jgi:ATP-dependent DNA ligase
VDELKPLFSEVMRKGLEGLVSAAQRAHTRTPQSTHWAAAQVLKDPTGVYEPAKRRWIKIKKDYLDDVCAFAAHACLAAAQPAARQGAMADSADLVVLGAYYGSGRKGGVLSTFLMGTPCALVQRAAQPERAGVHDAASGRWKTVCKVGSGFTDATLTRCGPLRCTAWLNVGAAQAARRNESQHGGKDCKPLQRAARCGSQSACVLTKSSRLWFRRAATGLAGRDL